MRTTRSIERAEHILKMWHDLETVLCSCCVNAAKCVVVREDCQIRLAEQARVMIDG